MYLFIRHDAAGFEKCVSRRRPMLRPRMPCACLISLLQMLMLLDMVWSNRENTIVPEQQPDYSHPPSSWRRRRAEIETTRTSWTPSAAVDVTQATVIAPDGESGGPLIINSTAPNFKDPDHNATAKYAEATESAVKAKHLQQGRVVKVSRSIGRLY